MGHLLASTLLPGGAPDIARNHQFHAIFVWLGLTMPGDHDRPCSKAKAAAAVRVATEIFVKMF
jgi:hypothetical protein